MRVNDDTDLLAVEIPEEWSDGDRRPFEENVEVIGPAVAASTNLAEYFGGLGTPGVLFVASRVWAQTLDEGGFLDQFNFK